MPNRRKETREAIYEAEASVQDTARRLRGRKRAGRTNYANLSPEKKMEKIRRRDARRKLKGSRPVETRRCGEETLAGKKCIMGRYIVLVPTAEGYMKPMLARACFAHLSQEERDRYARIMGSDKAKRIGAGRPKVMDILKEQVEAHVAEIIQPLLEALEADKPIVVGNGPHASVELHPDHRTRILAVQELFDRVYGKSKQTTELTGQVTLEPVEVPTDSQREQEVAAILAKSGALGLVAAAQNPINQN